ncbi:MAG: fused DSP-PTPase phosphatase/NAD kinase-like protein [Pyrinomonadaceae bacterium]
MVRIFKFTAVFALAVILAGQFGSGQVSNNLPNFQKVNDNLYRGAEPKEAGIAELKKLGIKTVIDMGNGEKDSKNERGWVENAGMGYRNIHLHNWLKSKPSDTDAILKEIEKPENQPVFLHCKRGSDRTGTVIAIYRMKNDGWTPDQAMDEAKKFGFGWWQFWMKDFVNDYYRDHIAKK